MKLDPKELTALKELLNSHDLVNLSPEHKSVIEQLKERLNSSDKMVLYADGAADLHTETAGIGGVIYRNDEELFTYSEFIGKKTNNEAEYSALLKGIDLLLELGSTSAEVFLDSELVVRQVNGQYKVKNERMQALYSEVMKKLPRFKEITVSHIPRDKNKVADKLSKDGMLSGR